MPDSHPTISIVIPAFRAGETFAAVLDALKAQSLNADEIVIADSESDDGTRECAERHGCRVMTIKRSDFDHGRTRNLAIRSTNSDIIVLMTQDALPADENMLEELIKPLADRDIALAYGRQMPRAKAGRLERFAREYNYPAHPLLKDKRDIERMGMKAFFCSNSCSAMRRETFERMGGFAEGVIVNEDMLFAARAIMDGMGIYYAADARVYHSHSFTLWPMWKRYFRIGQFFADNEWLTTFGGPSAYAGNVLRSGMATFRHEKDPGSMVMLLAETAFKAGALKTGFCCRKYLAPKASDKRSECPEYALKKTP
jgi:rhamnosyltransferase